MRVTDKLVYDSALRDTAQARERLEAAQRAASTGRRVVHPSDDPGAAGQLAALDIGTARLRAFSSATDQASGEIQAADAALSGVGNALARAKQLAVQFSSATYTAEQRASGGAEVGSLIQQVLAGANAKFGGRFLFGGTADASSPFDAAGAYLGSDVARQVEIAPGVMQTSSIDAHAVLRGFRGGVDVIGSLQQLQMALAANDQTAVLATLDLLDRSVVQVAGARADAGLAMNTFDAASATARQLLEEETSRQTQLGDADIIDSSVKLTQAQQALQASLAASAQGFKLTLLDFLR